MSAIRDKMLVVNKELTREGVKSKVAKCQFDSQKNAKAHDDTCVEN